MTRLDSNNSSVVADIRHNSNTQWDFLNFVIYLVQSEALKSEDVLVMDNASVHIASDSWDIVVGILKAAGVRICFLLTYSPELNAAEFVFQKIKSYIRTHRSHNDNLHFDTIEAICSITKIQMWGFYKKALFGWLKQFSNNKY